MIYTCIGVAKWNKRVVRRLTSAREKHDDGTSDDVVLICLRQTPYTVKQQTISYSWEDLDSPK